MAGYQEIFDDETYLRHGIDAAGRAPSSSTWAPTSASSACSSTSGAKNPRIFAFEPFPPTFEALCANVGLYGLDVRLFHSGVADRPGRTDFTFYPNAPGLSGRFAGTAEDLAENRALVLDWLERRRRRSPPEQIEEVHPGLPADRDLSRSSWSPSRT